MTATPLARALALASLLALASACRTTAPSRPTQVGDWHFGGSSEALWSTTDGGDFGDTDTFSVQATGGRFATDQLLVEGILGAGDTNIDDGSGDESDVTTFQIGAGARYYTTNESSSRPYLGLRGGLDHVNVDDDFTGTDESDTSPFLEARLGLEAFVAESASVDLGIRWHEVFSRQLGSVEDDLSTFGLFVGFSVWL